MQLIGYHKRLMSKYRIDLMKNRNGLCTNF